MPAKKPPASREIREVETSAISGNGNGDVVVTRVVGVSASGNAVASAASSSASSATPTGLAALQRLQQVVTKSGYSMSSIHLEVFLVCELIVGFRFSGLDHYTLREWLIANGLYPTFCRFSRPQPNVPGVHFSQAPGTFGLIEDVRNGKDVMKDFEGTLKLALDEFPSMKINKVFVQMTVGEWEDYTAQTFALEQSYRSARRAARPGNFVAS